MNGYVPVLPLLLFALALAGPAQAGNCWSAPPDQPSVLHAQGLLVSGTLEQGVGTLHPAFPLPWLTPQPDLGAYSLVFRDAKGELLNKIYFDAQPKTGSTGVQDVKTFSLVAPFPVALHHALAAIELYHGEERLDTLQATHPPPGAAALREPPVARILHPGVVRLTWDPTIHPGAMVLDSDTGEELAVAHGGTADLRTEAKELAVSLSDGLRTVSRRVAVGP
jgi:hypothetical protein